MMDGWDMMKERVYKKRRVHREEDPDENTKI